MKSTFSDAIRSAQAAANSATTESEKHLAYAVGQSATGLQESIKDINLKLDALARPAP